MKLKNLKVNQDRTGSFNNYKLSKKSKKLKDEGNKEYTESKIEDFLGWLNNPDNNEIIENIDVNDSISRARKIYNAINKYNREFSYDDIYKLILFVNNENPYGELNENSLNIVLFQLDNFLNKYMDFPIRTFHLYDLVDQNSSLFDPLVTIDNSLISYYKYLYDNQSLAQALYDEEIVLNLIICQYEYFINNGEITKEFTYIEQYVLLLVIRKMILGRTYAISERHPIISNIDVSKFYSFMDPLTYENIYCLLNIKQVNGINLKSVEILDLLKDYILNEYSGIELKTYEENIVINEVHDKATNNYDGNKVIESNNNLEIIKVSESISKMTGFNYNDIYNLVMVLNNNKIEEVNSLKLVETSKNLIDYIFNNETEFTIDMMIGCNLKYYKNVILMLNDDDLYPSMMLERMYADLTVTDLPLDSLDRDNNDLQEYFLYLFVINKFKLSRDIKTKLNTELYRGMKPNELFDYIIKNHLEKNIKEL